MILQDIRPTPVCCKKEPIPQITQTMKRPRSQSPSPNSETKTPMLSFGEEEKNKYESDNVKTCISSGGTRRRCTDCVSKSKYKSTARALIGPVSVHGMLFWLLLLLLLPSSSSSSSARGARQTLPLQIDDATFELNLRDDPELASLSVRAPASMPHPQQPHHKRQRSADRSPDMVDRTSNPLFPELGSPHIVVVVARTLQTEQQCTLSMAIRDSDRDDQLTEDEYVNFLNQLFGNQYANTPFESLPCELQQTFSEYADDSTNTINVQGTKPGQTPTTEQEATLSAMCTQVISIVDSNPAPGPCSSSGGSPPSSPAASPVASAPVGDGGGTVDCTGTVSETQCKTALAIADLSRDDQLDDTEYVRFVNGLSSNAYSGSSFDQLPANVQTTFQKFAVTSGGQIDVAGSKPGQTPTQEQAAFLASLCCETDLAISNADQPTGPSPTLPPASSPTQPSVSSPSQPSSTTASPPPTYRPQICRTAMASSDFNRDDSMNEDEYVRFLDRLTQNQYQGIAFNALSQPLQANFVDRAQGGEINIVGSKPGQTPTTAQSEFLDEFCLDTAVAIQTDDSAGPQPTSPTTPTAPSAPPASGGTPTTASPQDDGGGTPAFSDNLCRTAMATSDFNRDGFLDEEEYVRFLNRLTQNQFQGETFETLEDPLPQTFETLTDDSGQIPIFGAVPGQDATAEQEAALLDVCLEVSKALDQLGGASPPATAPTTPTAPTTRPPSSPPPTAPQPTLPPGQAEVYSSFKIINTSGLKAEDLESGPDRDGLNTAYAVFAKNTVAVISESRRRRLPQLRGRRLAVKFIDGSDDIYLLLDDDCPEGMVKDTNTCQTAFAKYLVDLDTEDPTKVSDDYSTASQQLIEDGDLQKVLTEEDPRNKVRVVGTSSPLTSTMPPTAAPLETGAPTESGYYDDLEDAATAVGAIVGGVFGGIAFCAFIGWLTTKFGKKSGKGLDDDDKMGGGDDDGSDGEKENGFGFGGKDDSGKGEDNVFGDKPEQAQDTKNVFGFGKKNKQNDDDNAFGIDATPVNGNFGDDDDNLALFAFDEPSVARENGGGDEGSVAEKNNAFGATDAGWGNTDNGGAGGFFGNDGGGWEDGEKAGSDNFFGGAGFSREEPKESDGSGSGTESASGEGSYTSSEDSTYESGNPDGNGEEDEDEGSGSNSRSSADEGSSYQSGSMSSGLRQKSDHMDGDDGNWDGIAAAADSFGSSIPGSSKRSSRKNDSLTNGSDVDQDEGSFSGSESGSESASASESSATTMTDDREKRDEYRAQVDALVRLVLPDEVEKVDAMMEQFKGREAELVSTLQTMQERSATQRARAAVHKSKNRPQRGDEGAFTLSSALSGGAEGAAAGTAAIAAASLPIPAENMFEEGNGGFRDDHGANFQDDQGFGNEDAFGAPADGPYEEDEEGSYNDDEGSQSHSGSGSRSGSRSYYSDEGSQSRSGSGSRSGSRSYYSDEGSQVSGSQASRSHYSNEGSQVSGSQRSQSQRSGSRKSQVSGSQRSRSQRSGSYSGSGSRSQYSGEGSRSQYSGEGSRSQYSDEEGSRSQTGSRSQEGSRSHYSGEEGSQEGSRSSHSGKEGSQEGSRSHYSGEEGSQEGSRSYYSGEEGSQEGSRSYHSGEEGSQSQGSRSQYSDEDGGDEERSFGE